MLTVALTGGIATGKSVVAGVLEELGCYIYKADSIARSLTAPKSPAWKKIIEHFGPHILKEDKDIDRKKLGEIIFSNPGERLFLNELLHPLVLKDRLKRIVSLNREGKYSIFVSEAALTVEAGLVPSFDKVIVTHCSQKIQIGRLMDRDHISRSAALNKIRSQMPQREKMKYADYKIDTSGSLLETVERSEQVYRFLIWDFKMMNSSIPG